MATVPRTSTFLQYGSRSRRPLACRGAVCLVLCLATLATSGRSVMAEPIGWMERYALADDRQAMLAELIPGSNDHYFYHCLYYQTSGQLERSEAVVRQWLAAHKGTETPAITAMIDRQRLLTYGESPQRTIDYLVRKLGIQLNHSPPATKNERRYPSRLDAGRLEVDRIVKDAVRRNDALKPLGLQHLAELFRSGRTEGLGIDLNGFLSRVSGPYIDNLDQLVAKEISTRRANQRRFGDLKAHRFLTLDELQSVARLVPEIADNNEFVNAMLRRMRPDADSDLSQQPLVRIEYLTRVEAYVQTLPPSYNGLKASAAYRLLEANLSHGEFDRELFDRYLQLPRVSPIVHLQFGRRSGQRANLNQDFMDVALLPPIGNEEPVVRAYLEHFLRNAANTGEFSRYLQPDYLRRVFAETKLLYGVGDTEQWYKMLTPEQRQSIRDAVELRLTPSNPKYFAADAPTRLIVDVKNIDELVIRIYEINTASYYRTHDKQIDTDIDLDGLVATHESRITYSQPAVQRHRESLDLDEITGRGVWIVDLVGKGVRARALVKRGAIEHVDSSSASGMVFTIIDENREPIPSATMWVESREFIADDEGRILLPPVVDQVSRRAIISDGSLASPLKFRHLRETYRLNAGMYLDRTQLQSGGHTELLIRPRLLLGKTAIDPQTLKDVSVQIEAKDLDEIVTTLLESDLQLDQNGELVIRVRIPPRLAQLSVKLSGKIDAMADGKEQTLTTTRNWDIAGIRRTNYTHDAFLARDGNDYVIEVCGRNGELLPRASVSVALTTEFCNSTISETLQSDDRGRIQLGPLEGVTRIHYSVPGGIRHERDLDLDQVRWPDEIHTTSERPIQLPLSTMIDNVDSMFRLLEIRNGQLYVDRSDELSARSGLLVINSLAAGDYQLVDRTNDVRTRIAVVDGPAIGSVAAGQTRHRLMSPALPLGIASITRDEEGLKIQLTGNTSVARVHLYGSRYLDQTSPIGQLHLPFPGLTGRRVALPACGYVSDLRLGDEYQYVLRRRYAKKYPGVMLPQPGLILNPWETEETTNASQSVREGDLVPRSVEPGSDGAMEAAQSRADMRAAAIGSDYDFLADPGVVVANLRPDADGIVAIPDDVIDGLPLLQIIACDPVTMVQRTVTSPLPEIETVDLRLAKALDASRPLTFQRGVSIASPDQPLDLASLGSAQMQVYATVAELLKFYRTLINDPRLDDFEQLANWHTLSTLR